MSLSVRTVKLNRSLRHRLGLFVGSLMLVNVMASSHAVVYQSVTPDGRVVYTDNADTAYRAGQMPNNIRILDTLTSNSTTTPSNPLTTPAPNAAATSHPNTAQPVLSDVQSNQSTTTEKPLIASKIKVSERGDYQLAILTPKKDMAYRRGITVDISVQLTPSLKAGDRLVYSLADKHLATSQQTNFSLSTTDLNPGSYTVVVNLENVKGQVIATSSHTINILPNNGVLRRQRQAAAAAKAAYDALPWYKKLSINVNL